MEVFLGTALAVLLASTGIAQTLPTPQTGPQPTFQVWGYIVADFRTRVQSYFNLRNRLEEGLPPLSCHGGRIGDQAGATGSGQENPSGPSWSDEGDIFSPAISAEFKEVLASEMNATTWAVIMDDNPGEFSHDINGIYPEGEPYSTVPGTILAALPGLPDDVEYRFLGRHLILLDIRADVILDRIPYAIRCADCDHDDLPRHQDRWPRD